MVSGNDYRGYLSKVVSIDRKRVQCRLLTSKNRCKNTCFRGNYPAVGANFSRKNGPNVAVDIVLKSLGTKLSCTPGN